MKRKPRPRVLTLPKEAGKCPEAYAGRHVVSVFTQNVCVLCLQTVTVPKPVPK